jgi:hypothetical protein
MILAGATVIAGLGASSAQAALSGYYDSVEQIGVILGSAEVADALHQAPIGAISNTGTRKDGAREWTIRVQECDLKVYLIPVLPDGPGKTTYKLDMPGACE